MTARPDAIGSDGPEAALLRAAPGDDPLAVFLLESQKVGNESGDIADLRLDAIASHESSVPFAMPTVNGGKPRTKGVVNRIKRVLQALDVVRDLEKTVDNRLAALRGLDQEVQDRSRRLECLNQEIIVGAAHADDILRANENTLADFENRVQAVSTSLGGHVAAWEARKASAVDTVEQLGRRAADTIDDLEGRVADCEARAHIAQQTIARLDGASSETLHVLQERSKEAEEQHQSLGRLITEAAGMATSLTALEERLPALTQCSHELARIELAIPQIARQLEDLHASAEQQSRSLAIHQQRVRQTLDESQKTADAVSELEGRIVDLSGSDQLFDRLEKCVAQLEQRTAAATGEVRDATRATDELHREIARCQQQIERLTTAAQDEAEKLNALRRHAAFQGANRASSRSAYDLLNALRLDLLNTVRLWSRRTNTARGVSAAREIFGSGAFALSAAIILLVAIVWRISPVENQRPEKPLPAPVTASGTLTVAPTSAATPPIPLTADRRDRPDVTRAASRVSAVPVPPVVVSKTPVATRVPTAAGREQSRKEATTPQFVGTLRIESDPAGAAAFVNQKPVGNTPVVLKDLRAGSYVVRLESKGYQRWSTSATVSAVRQERVRAKLERERSR